MEFLRQIYLRILMKVKEMNKIKRSINKRGIFGTIFYILCTIIYRFFRLFFDLYLNSLKLKKKYVLFSSIPDFSDNSKTLYEYMSLNYHDRLYIWLVDNPKEYFYENKENTIFVKKCSSFHSGPTLKALYYTSLSEEIYYTHGSPLGEKKAKKGQLVINLWHGCGYKKSSKSAKSFIQMNYFDYVLVPGKVFIDTKAEFFGCNKSQVLDIGYPRYDLFHIENEKTKEFVSNLKGGATKFILWMPTFRKTGDNFYPEESIVKNFDLPILNSIDELKELDDFCKKSNIILCIKRHPLQKRYIAEDHTLNNIVFMDSDALNKNKIDMYSLLRYTDGLITDYSSIAIDYLLIDKPIAFTLDDYDNYQNTRGFVFDNPKKYMPGHYIYEISDLEEYIEDVKNNIDLYKKERENIMYDVHNKCDDYCERIMHRIDILKEEKQYEKRDI